MIIPYIITTARRILVFIGLCTGLVTCTQADVAEAAAKRLEASTVRVVVFVDDEVNGHGSGFIISNNGHVATNRHVIEEAEGAVVLFAKGDRVFFRTAELVAVSHTADLAILKIEPIPGTSATLLASSELSAGQPVITVGFPRALDSGTWTTLEGVETSGRPGEGRITSEEARSDFIPAVFPGAVAKTSTSDGCLYVLHSAKISGGNSGGPLADAQGRVCGINTAILPASLAGVDYPISIHASELVALARAHSIPIDVSSSKLSVGGSMSGLQMLLYIALAVFAVVLFMMVLRKPRTVMVDAMSRVVGGQKRPGLPSHQPKYKNGHTPVRSPAPASAGTMRLRGRDPHGVSYSLTFHRSDFERCGGRLVIGRNNHLSQLVIPHDSVSRQHATLLYRGGNIQIEDRNSGNGTILNGRNLLVGQAAVPLQPGDRLILGEVELVFEITN
jgi:hypothetical protein